MSDKDIAYTARVSAAVWMIRKARKIASLLGDKMPDEQQAIEEEIVAIGRKMYEEACKKPEPEVTHDPGQDHELEAYVAAVRELVPDAERWFVANDYWHRFSVEQSAERWREYGEYLKGLAQQ